jgi:diguanylate cyclase (GGDEF)-like protein
MSRQPWNTFRIDEHPDFKALPRDRCTLTMLQGPSPGSVQPVAGDELVLGRDEELVARIDDRGMSRRHARIHRVLAEWAIEDLGSTNGTFVNGKRVGNMPVRLADGDRIQLGETTVLRVSMQDADEQEVARRAYESTVKDPLTGAFNRRHFDERLEAEHAYARRHGQALTVMFVDLDHFKRVNDTHGHQAGDAVLVQAAKAMMASVRTEDLVARFGGEEFVVLSRALEREGAAVLAERLRAAIEKLAIEIGGAAVPVTASVGWATQDKLHDHPHAGQLLAAADRGVYAAKQAGRNRVATG